MCSRSAFLFFLYIFFYFTQTAVVAIADNVLILHASQHSCGFFCTRRQRCTVVPLICFGVDRRVCHPNRREEVLRLNPAFKQFFRERCSRFVVACKSRDLRMQRMPCGIGIARSIVSMNSEGSLACYRLREETLMGCRKLHP